MVGRSSPARPTEPPRAEVYCSEGVEEDTMETMGWGSAVRRRCVAIGTAAILATAALLPSAVSADRHEPSAPVSLPAQAVDAGAHRATRDHPPGDEGRGCTSASEHADEHPQCARPHTPNIDLPGAVTPGHSGTSASASVKPSKAAAEPAGVASSKGSAPAESPAPLPVAAPAPTSPSTSTGAGASASPAVPSSTGMRRPSGSGGAPVPVLPAPSQPTVLGPVPLVIPAIGGIASPAGGALPWTWFLALAVVDVGLTVGILIRRRRRRGDGPGVR
jgi:hypothetical protein